MKKFLKLYINEILMVTLFIVGIVLGSLMTSLHHEGRVHIVKDPVAVYANGTTMVISSEGTFSYAGAIGIISQNQLLKKLGVSK